jgi:inorganic pyrophosphatase
MTEAATVAEAGFWQMVDQMALDGAPVIERRAGAAHPHFPETRYPLDYGSLESWRSGDGEQVDIWVGSLKDRVITGAVISVDYVKRDCEVKWLLGCSAVEANAILAFHNQGGQRALLVERPR